MKKLVTFIGAGLVSASLLFAGPAAAASGGHGTPAGQSGGTCHCAEPAPVGGQWHGPIPATSGDRLGTGGELPYAPVGESAS